ncbi:MAG: 3'-5' exonuclease [Mobilitalea sp.]
MHYIVFDLEFNQDLPSLQKSEETLSLCPYEIIQIGAMKLDQSLNHIASFNRYIRPVIYSEISPIVTKLTGITSGQLQIEKYFPEVYQDFIAFIDDKDAVFCTWGISDVREIFRNATYHNQKKEHLPLMYINLQPYVIKHLHLPQNQLISLQNAVETLNILKPYQFHNALYDTYYTTEVFKKIDSKTLEPIRYDSNIVKPRPRSRKKVLETEKLLEQFQKMYLRDITEDEKSMILLAYKMGRTNQFLKEV